MSLLVGRPLDKLARTLLTTPPAPVEAVILHDETVLPIVNLRDVMGQAFLVSQTQTTNAAAAVALATITTTSDGFYEIGFQAAVTGPIGGTAAVRRVTFRIIDETSVLWQEVYSFLLAGVNSARQIYVFLKSGWSAQIFTVDAFALTEVIQVTVNAIQRYQ